MFHTLLMLAVLTQVAGQTPAPRPTPRTPRLDLQSASASTRVREVKTSAGVVTSHDWQYTEQVRVRVTFDAAGRFAVVAGAASGEVFTSNWLNTGIGLGVSQWRHSVKQLYASMSPLAGFEAQFGGILPVRGESTEITQYDNDGYLEGVRVTIRRPRNLFFDEISATSAYLGDITTPNVFARLHRIGESNYHEVLVAKRLGASVTASGSLTSVSGARTLRSAITVRSRVLGLLDLVRIEAYRRTTSDTGGYALYAERKIGVRATVVGGWADIDRFYGGLNADRFNFGRRAFVNASVPVTSSLTAQIFAHHAALNAFAVPNAVRAEAILVWDIKGTLARSKSATTKVAKSVTTPR